MTGVGRRRHDRLLLVWLLAGGPFPLPGGLAKGREMPSLADRARRSRAVPWASRGGGRTRLDRRWPFAEADFGHVERQEPGFGDRRPFDRSGAGRTGRVKRNGCDGSSVLFAAAVPDGARVGERNG